MEGQATLTLKLACSGITSASIWLSVGLSLPGFCLLICVMWRKGLACGHKSLTHMHGEGLPSSLRGLVSEEHHSPAGEAGKEGWLNVNVQDRRRRGLWEKGKLIVCKLRKGEGNGNPLQYSCLENPMVGGAW